jgi:hypothetical protein
MRYNQPTTCQTNRPIKNEKLPTGATDICLGMRGEVGLPVDEGDEEMHYLNQIYSTDLHIICRKLNL